MIKAIQNKKEKMLNLILRKRNQQIATILDLNIKQKYANIGNNRVIVHLKSV